MEQDSVSDQSCCMITAVSQNELTVGTIQLKNYLDPPACSPKRIPGIPSDFQGAH